MKNILNNGRQDKKESNPGRSLDKFGKRTFKTLEEKQRERNERKILLGDQKI
jgi:hypothetical protein